MEKIVLQANRREIIGKQVKQLRRQGRLPAVLYGKNFEPISVTLDSRESNRILPRVTASHLITVEVDGDQHNVLVREKQYHPVLGKLIHIDFLVVSLTEKLRANVPLSLVGESPAVRDLNGILVSGIEEIEVECLPQDLPERIVVDVSSLNEFGSAIHIKDIKLSENIRVLTDLEEMVAIITAPQVEEEVVEEVEEVEPEVIEKGKKEEEEEED